MRKVLFMLHIPGAIHGSSIIGQNIYKSEFIKSEFDTRYFNLLASREVADTGKISLSKVLQFIIHQIALPYNLLRFRPKYCYYAISVNGIAFIRDLFFILWLRIFNVKTVYHFHNKGVRLNSERKWYRRAYFFAFKDQYAIVLSTKLKEDIVSYFDDSRIFILPNGIHSENKLSFGCEMGMGIQKILFISNLYRSKGIFVLLDALSLLKDRNVGFSCDIIGGLGDVSTEEVEDYIENHFISEFVKFHGKKIGEEKNSFLEQANMFVFPTFYENECFPLVLLEAMHYGLPIITCPEGGIEDMVKDGLNGYLVKARDHVQLADKIQALIMDPEQMKVISEYNRYDFKKNYSIQKFEENLCEILNSIIK